MNRLLFTLVIPLVSVISATASVRIDDQAFGEKLGGWTKRGKQAAEYAHSGASYRTYKPEITPTPDGGIFVSLRIDHVRGWLSSDDHAVLEITVNDKGAIVSAQSNIAIQGRSIASDVIKGSTDANRNLGGTDRAVQIGMDLVADLSEKMLREKIVEAGRVSFPAVLRHNYNLLFQAVRVEPDSQRAIVVEEAEGSPAAPATPTAPTLPKPGAAKLDIKPYGGSPKVDLPVKE